MDTKDTTDRWCVLAAVCCVGARYNCSPILTTRNLQRGTRAEGTNMGSWSRRQEVATILYYENVCHLATAALQHCRAADHTPTAECVDTAALTVPAAPLQHCRRQTSARWRHGAQLSNCESLVSTFLYSSHRLLLLLLLSRLTMRLHCAICLLKNW